MTELETERLVLRQWRTADREPWAALNADPRVMEHFPSTLTRGRSDEFVDRHAALIDERGWGLWAVGVKDGPPFVGFTGLAVPGFTVPDPTHPGAEPVSPTVEVGWRLAAEHWGRGYAPEAARAAVEFGFDVLGLDEIVSFTFVGNRRSRRVMEKLGMCEVGAFDHPGLPGHRLQRHVLYRLRRPGHPPGRSVDAPLR